jgi:S1-C subfamily serine protease
MRFLAIFLLAFLSSPGHARTPEIVSMHEQMLYTVVQVAANRSMGSGTVIWSEEVDGEWLTLILTNHHVVRANIAVKTEWSPSEQEDVKTERLTPVKVRWHLYSDLSTFVGTTGKTAIIKAYDANADLALIQISDTERGADYVARLLPEEEDLYQGETVYAVGGGLGKPPFMSSGILGHMEEVISGFPYLLATAPVIGGNSGGGLFHLNIDTGQFELIGVPARVSATWGSGAITHMGWAIKMETVRAFLREHCYGFILADEQSGCAEEGEGDE